MLGSHSVMLMREVSTLTRVLRTVLAYCVRRTRIILFIENDHMSFFSRHDLSMTVGTKLIQVPRPSNDRCDNLIENRSEVRLVPNMPPNTLDHNDSSNS